MPRRSRLERSPKGIFLQFTDLQRAIVQRLNQYHSLPFSFFPGLVDSSPKYLGELLRKMFEEKNQFGSPLLTRDDRYGDYYGKQECYMLGAGGKKASKQLGYETVKIGNGGHLVHETMLVAAAASIEIGALAHKIIYKNAGDVFNRPECPDETRKLIGKSKFIVKLDEKHTMAPDNIFALGYPSHYLYFSHEVDTGTETLTAGKSSIVKKMLDLKSFYIKQLYKRAYGVPSLITLFTTVSEARMHAMMELAVKHQLAHALLFNFDTRLAKKATPYKPMPELFTKPCMRPDGRTFSLLTGK